MSLLMRLSAIAVLVLVVLVSHAEPGPSRAFQPERVLLALADTDSVAARALPQDTTRKDTLRKNDSSFVAAYFGTMKPDQLSAALFARQAQPFRPALGNYWRHELKMDSTGKYYVARELVASQDVRYPVRLTPEQYRQARLNRDVSLNWESLVEQQALARRNQQTGGVGFDVVIPGGREGAFSQVFGTGNVSLKVTGQADIAAGFDYRKSDLQQSLFGSAARTDPTFKQNLTLGITGSIGDKLNVDVSWDTQNQFDYQNQLKLKYTGYDDDIVKSIEAGNVTLESPSQLIRGGQSLFGIKSEFQVGALRVTTVASQQEGESNQLSLQGGSEETEFDLQPTDYDDNSHFFLGYYFRNRWEDAFANRPTITLGAGFNGISEIEVWKLQYTAAEDQGIRQAVAMVDLGESEEILTRADQYTEEVLPDDRNDNYSDAEIQTSIIPGTAATDDFLKSAKGLQSSDYQIGRFKLLRRGIDYQIDDALGYISLTQRLQDKEALAVAYSYVGTDGSLHRVGTFSTSTGGSEGGQNDQRLVLKLLRPITPKPPDVANGFNPAYWYLELRNLYRLRGYNLSQDGFDLDVVYEPSGKTPSPYLPGVGISGQSTPLIQLLGLDSLTVDLAPRPDNQFDWIEDVTINPERGLLIFPYLEPFGSHMARLIDERGSDDAKSRKSLYVFDRLYREKKESAQRDKQHDIFRIRGAYRGAVKEYYDLGAYAGLVPGSVKVVSGGAQLAEGADFTVDYSSGTVQITNPAYTSPGRNIDISWEQNQLLNPQKKTLLGVRAELKPSDHFLLGSTMYRLSQKSPADKYRIGEEPVSNFIWGLDGRIDLAPRWLTRAVDALPLIQTKEPSSLLITGEVAQLRPSFAQTFAFDETRRKLKDIDRSFKPDELNGTSYVDDFEGFENTFSLRQPGAWQLSSPPVHPSSEDPREYGRLQYSRDRARWRGNFAWYTLPENIKRETGLDRTSDAVRTWNIKEIFPNRDTREVNPILSTLDLYINPHQRGPYNYTDSLASFFQNPKKAWGGMTQRLPEGYNDFEVKNIEFLEFVFMPFADNAQNDAGPDAKLYIDLGSISEDVIPNERLNNEDGLSTSTLNAADFDVPADQQSQVPASRLPRIEPTNSVNYDSRTGRTEDLGLDGLASYDPDKYREGDVSAAEQDVLKSWVDKLNPNELADPLYRAEVEKALADPSGDDYHYYGSDYFTDPRFYPSDIYPKGAPIQERFSRYFAGVELNAYESQTKFGMGGRGNSRYPDSEDLNLNSTVDTDNSYYEYEIPLSLSKLRELAAENAQNDFIVTEIVDQNGKGTGWFQAQIPLKNFTRTVGSISGFSVIESVRMWTDGHEVPATIRFATLELISSQWLKSVETRYEKDDELNSEDTRSKLTVSSVNNEENADVYSSPNSAVVSKIRSATSYTGPQNAREQSMVLRVEDLDPGRQQAIFRTFQGYDLLKYEMLRMFVHMHGTLRNGKDLVELGRENAEAARSKVRLFVRLGSNETNDYYEYEQPLSPGPFPQTAKPENRGPQEIDDLWQTNSTYNGQLVDLNSMSLRLSALNLLKVARDRYQDNNGRYFPADSVFWSSDRFGQPASDLVPNVEEFAPPGTRLAIKGNPSLADVNTIVIGIRNPAGPDSQADEDFLQAVEVWINELRVSGYDVASGWAGIVNADMKLADLGTLRASLQHQTDGFGELSSTLGERDLSQFTNWGLTTDLQLNKFIPERFGWRIPVSFQIQSNTSTPRYSPSGDVRVQDMLDQIDAQQDTDAGAKAQQRNEILQSAQEHTMQRSFSASIGKDGSKSPLLRNTLDGIDVRYSYSDATARNPMQRQNDSWQWSTSAQYRLNLRKAKTVRPFWFLDPVPILGMASDLRFNYLPQNFSASGSATRNFSIGQERARFQRLEDGERPRPDLVQYPLREQQTFNHRRDFAYQYNPFSFLNLGLDTHTDQSLNGISADTVHSVIVWDEQGQDYRTISGLTLTQALNDGTIDSTMIRNDLAFQTSKLNVLPTGQVANRIFSGRYSPRTNTYNQRFTATFQPRFNSNGWLSWVLLQPITYNSTYTWSNGAIGQNNGAGIANRVDVGGSLTVRPQDFWRKFGFYKTLEADQKKIEADALARRQRAIQQKRDAQTARKNREERLKAAEKQAKEQGKTLDELLAADSVLAATLRDTTTIRVEGGGFRLPTPSLRGIVRRTILTLTGISDFTISYSNGKNSSLSNVGRMDADGNAIVNYTFYDALRGYGPPVGYRFGLDDRIDLSQRVFSGKNLVADQLSNSNKLTARTSLQPSRSLQVSLNWNADWGNQESVIYRQQGASGISTTNTQMGTTQASVWAFGASYRRLFERQFQTYRQDYDRWQSGGGDAIGDLDGDGRVVLTNTSVVEDFQQAFISGARMVDSRKLLPMPMPGWVVTYSGLSNWPLIRGMVSSATLRHNYSATYNTDFRTDVAGAQGNNDTFILDGKTIQYRVPQYQVGSVRVSERYAPLVGVDLSFKGNLSTNVSWNKTNVYSLSAASFELSEMKTDEMSITASWQQMGLRLPFLPARMRLSNRLTFSMTASLSTTTDLRYRLKPALAKAANQYGLGQNVEDLGPISLTDMQWIRDTRRLTIAPKLGYQFSNRVSADFTLKYENYSDPQDTRQPAYTNINGGFNVRVSFAN